MLETEIPEPHKNIHNMEQYGAIPSVMRPKCGHVIDGIFIDIL